MESYFVKDGNSGISTSGDIIIEAIENNFSKIAATRMGNAAGYSFRKSLFRL